ncbi:MAG: lipid asymmetry maintenance protein MlaB [Syntrophobacteraceae bacterium]
MINADGQKCLEMQVTEGVQGEVLVHLEGVLDRDTVPDIRKRLLRLARREGLSRLAVDFSKVARLDTAGLAVMVEALRAVSQKGSILSVDGLSEEAKRLFRLARLEETFRVGGEPKAGE